MFRLLKPKRSPEEQKEILQARQSFTNDLQTATTNIKTSSERNEILPETTSYLYSLVKQTHTWLDENPDADVIELATKKSQFQNEYKQIIDTEPKRIFFLTWMLTVASASKELHNAKTIDDSIFKKLQDLVTLVNTWYKKNGFTATAVDFEQQAMDVQNQTNALLASNGTAVSFLSKRFDQSKTYTKAQLRTELDKYNLSAHPQTDFQKKEAKLRYEIQKQADEDAKPVEPSKVILDTALTTFLVLIVIVFCVLAGSFAANFAIGRTRPYRVLYFLYGAIPLFAPFVLLYALYKRIREGPIPLYAILPLSVEPATTRLGKILWYPFYWTPDKISLTATEIFTKSLVT
jgi:hypothetical protein